MLVVNAVQFSWSCVRDLRAFHLLRRRLVCTQPLLDVRYVHRDNLQTVVLDLADRNQTQLCLTYLKLDMLRFSMLESRVVRARQQEARLLLMVLLRRRR